MKSAIRCRTVVIDLNGRQVPVLVRGRHPLTDKDRAALTSVVEALQEMKDEKAKHSESQSR